MADESVPVLVRPASLQEQDAVATVLKDSGLPLPADMDVMMGDMLVAVAQGSVIGCAAVEALEAEGVLHLLAVLPDLRGYGIGRLLLANAEGVARHLGLTRLWLSAPADQAPFFAHCQWTPADPAAAPEMLRTLGGTVMAKELERPVYPSREPG